MIPYNPSSFNSNKTILEQILELKRWLQAHPSYEVFYSSEAGNTSQAITSYDLTAVTDPTNMEIGDVVVFHNSTFGVVTSVDTDNNEFGCDPCISLAGPTGPQGPAGVSITNVSVNASNHLICTLSNGTTIDAGVIQYDTYISISGSSGTLTDDEYAKALLNDTKIIETTGTSTLIHTKYGEDSSNIVYRILVPIDINPSPFTTIQSITINKSTHAWTKTANKLPIGIDNIKSGAYSVNRCVKSDGDGASYWGFIEGTEIKSTGITSGKVLQADGSGGSSWEDASGGSVELEIAYADIGQALSDSDYAICQNADKMIVNYGAGQLIEYTRDTESSTDIKFARTYNSGVDVIFVTKATKVVTNPTYKFIANSIDSETATNGQVLTADGNGGASWQNAGGGGTTLNKYYMTVPAVISPSDFTRIKNICNNAKIVLGISVTIGTITLLSMKPEISTQNRFLFFGTSIDASSNTRIIKLNISSNNAAFTVTMFDSAGVISHPAISSLAFDLVYLNDTEILS